MKTIFVLPLFIFFLGCDPNARLEVLEKEVDSLKARVTQLESKLAAIEKPVKKTTQITKKKTSNIKQSSEINITPLPLTPIKESVNYSTAGRCQAITKAGTQCSRTAQTGSSYCWQHQNTNSTVTNSPSTNYSGDRAIHTGPRGGQYYINSKGNKTYIKKKK